MGNQAHGGEVDVQMLQADLWILRTDSGDRVAPELRDLEHVRLVNRRHFSPPVPSGLKRHPSHSLDLGHAIAQSVDRSQLVSSAGLAVVEAASELPHDQQVY